MKELLIYMIRTETVRKTDCAFLAECMPRRFEKAMRYRFEQDRLLCLGAGLLMTEFGIRDEKEISYGRFGRLYVPGMQEFSISHSGSICILACGDAAHIGADIEEINEQHTEIAKAVFTEEELAWMKGDPVERFFRLWTWKECVMKATGMGINLPPESFEVLPFTRGLPARIRGRLWYPWGEKLGQSCISVCADEPFGRVRLAEIGENSICGSI